MRRSQMSRSKFRNLMLAIESQDEDYIDNLTTNNLLINKTHLIFGNPLHKAARIGNFKIFKKLIELGADIHLRLPAAGTPILHSAILSSNYDIVKYLIENGVDVNVMSKIHSCGIVETALHRAVLVERKEIIKLLLDNNANINAKWKDGITPIILAVQYNKFDAMDALIEYSPDLFCTYKDTNHTSTIFHYAILSKNWKLLHDWLFEFADTIDPNNNNNDFFSFFQSQPLLHFSLVQYWYNEDIVRYLLDVGIDVNVLDFYNNLAIESLSGLEFYPDGILLIKHHIVKLMAAGFHLCDRNINAVRTREFDHHLARCYSEVERMKKNKMEGSNIRFIEVLRKNLRYLARHLKFVDLKNILGRETKFPEYPIYNNMIFYKLRRVLNRVDCIKDSEEVIYDIFNELQLPCTFVRELYFYLSNSDLKKMIQTSTR